MFGNMEGNNSNNNNISNEKKSVPWEPLQTGKKKKEEENNNEKQKELKEMWYGIVNGGLTETTIQ